MFNSIGNPLKELWRGLRRVGLGLSLRTALYPLRLSWYRSRYGIDANGKTFSRSLSQALSHLLHTAMTQISPATQLDSIGDVIDSKRLPHGIELQCTHGLCTIEAITSRIMRVRVVREGPMPAYFSYATILETQAVPLEIQEEENEVVLATPDVRCHVRRSPFGLRMTDAEGREVTGGIETIGWMQEGGRCSKTFRLRCNSTVWANALCVSLPAGIVFS